MAGVILLLVQGSVAVIIASAGVTKVLSGPNKPHRVLGGLEIVVGAATLLPWTEVVGLVVAALLFAGFSGHVFLRSRAGPTADCGCGSVLPLPAAPWPHIATTALLAVVSSVVAATWLLGADREVWGEGNDTLVSVAVPMFGLCALRSHHTLKGLQVPTQSAVR